MTAEFLTAVIVILGAYILGSIPTGYWLVKALKGIDVREHGSKSTGATNVLRVAGKGPALFVFAFDLLKGYAPVLLAVHLENSASGASAGAHVLPPLAALAAIVGHSKSVFLGMQGGKSAATGLGTYFALNPTAAALTFVTWLVVLGAGRIVSLASILAVAVSPLYFFVLNSPTAYVVYAFLGFVYVTMRHKANIKRLMEGREPRIGQKHDEAPGEGSDEAQKDVDTKAQKI
ncbi:MAG TPA: glycerol-3-phosphate 1-O-acyltransferase PlsY [Candidatus Obscuribacterales bacterium]